MVLRASLDAVEGLARADTGDADAGLELTRHAREQVAGLRTPELWALQVAALEVPTALHAGKPLVAAESLRWATTRSRPNAAADLDVLRAMIELDAGRPEAARDLVLTESPRPGRLAGTALRAALVLGRAEMRLDRRSAARTALDRAFDECARTTVVRPFRFAGRDLRRLLIEQFGTFGPGGAEPAGFVHEALEALLTAEPTRGPDNPLTTREQTVLTLLARPCSIGDIAVQLQVSANTVKTHIRSLYLKLAVTSRREAVTVARERQLI